MIAFFYRLMKGRELRLAHGVGTREILTYGWTRGAMPFLRGLFSYPWLAKVGGPLFLGRGVILLYRYKLSVGKGCYIGDYSYINCLSLGGVRLGNGVTLREGAWVQLSSSLSNVGTLIEIGDSTYIGPRVVLGAGGPLLIGKNCQIGAGVNFIAENHLYKGEGAIFDKEVTKKGISVGDDCWIGNNVIVLDGVQIGNSCVIAAGAVVTKDVPDFHVAMGVPAKSVSSRVVE